MSNATQNKIQKVKTLLIKIVPPVCRPEYRTMRMLLGNVCVHSWIILDQVRKQNTQNPVEAAAKLIAKKYQCEAQADEKRGGIILEGPEKCIHRIMLDYVYSKENSDHIMITVGITSDYNPGESSDSDL